MDFESNSKTLEALCFPNHNKDMNSKDFVSTIAEHLTGEKPVIVIKEDEHGAVLTVTPKGNVSSLIGRNGSTIDAIRLLAKAIGYNKKHRIKVRLDEETRHSSGN